MRSSRYAVLAVLAVLAVISSSTAFAAAAPAAGTPPNLVINNGFEEDRLGLLSMWSTEAWVNTADAVRFFTTEQLHHSGKRSFVIANLQKNDSRGVQWVTVKPNTLYRLSAWVMAQDVDSAGIGANISVLGSTSAAGDLKSTGGKWVYVEMYGRTRPDQASLAVVVRLGFYGSLATGYAMFDDVALQAVSALPAGTRAIDFGANDASEVFPAGTVPRTRAEIAEPAGAPWVVIVILAVLAAAVSVVAAAVVIVMLRGGAGSPGKKKTQVKKGAGRAKSAKAEPGRTGGISRAVKELKWPWDTPASSTKGKKQLLPVTYSLTRHTKPVSTPTTEVPAPKSRPKKKTRRAEPGSAATAV